MKWDIPLYFFMMKHLTNSVTEHRIPKFGYSRFFNGDLISDRVDLAVSDWAYLKWDKKGNHEYMKEDKEKMESVSK